MELPLGTGPSGSNNTSEFVGGSAPKEQNSLLEPESLDSAKSQTNSDTKLKDNKKSIIASLLAQSSRHLFGPTSAPNLPLKHQVVSIDGLLAKLSYLKPEEVAQVKKAFQFADAAHLGQYRAIQRGHRFVSNKRRPKKIWYPRRRHASLHSSLDHR